MLDDVWLQVAGQLMLLSLSSMALEEIDAGGGGRAAIEGRVPSVSEQAVRADTASIDVQ